MSNSNSVITLKELAHKAIAKHSRRIFKHEAGVIKDRDPEDLHQMRVGMRRIQSAIAGLALGMDLPKSVTIKNTAKIGHSLGKLRDLDVLLSVLTDNYRPLLSTKEQKKLAKALKYLSKKRKHKLAQVRKTLNSKLYLNFKQELNDWVEQPKYTVSGDYSLDFVLPDLLLPSVSQFLLHPGWLVGVELKQGELKFPEISHLDANRLLKSEDVYLHDLRKSAKKTRYSLELFAQCYGESYHLYLKQVEAVQEILGEIQDLHVLIEVLEKALQSKATPLSEGISLSPIAENLPELADLLSKNRFQKWLEWQVLQKQFLTDKTRTEFRQTIQQGVREKRSGS